MLFPLFKNMSTTNIIIILTKFTYFTLAAPFYLSVQNPKIPLFREFHHDIKVSKNWFQKLLCGLLSSAGFLIHFWRNCYETNVDHQNPTSYFEALLSFMFVLDHIVILKIFWFDQTKLPTLVKCLQYFSNRSSQEIASKRSINYFYLATLYIISLLIHISGAVCTKTYRKYTPLPTILASILIFHSRLLDISLILLLLFITFSLWQSVQSFSVLLNTSRSWQEIECHWECLKLLSDTANNIIGNFVGFTIIETVLYYAFNLVSISAGDSVYNCGGAILVFVYFSGINMTYLYLAADVSFKVQRFKTWLFQKENRIMIEPISDAAIYVNQIDSNVVAIRAFGFIPITFRLLVTVSIKSSSSWYDNLLYNVA